MTDVCVQNNYSSSVHSDFVIVGSVFGEAKGERAGVRRVLTGEQVLILGWVDIQTHTRKHGQGWGS